MTRRYLYKMIKLKNILNECNCGCSTVKENFKDGKVKGKSRPGRVKRAGASCKGSVTDLRAKASKYGGEKGKMYHWCANMKGSRNEEKKKGADGKACWKGYRYAGTEDGKDRCVKIKEYNLIEYLRMQSIEEADYQGRKVKLNKPMQGDIKKFKVYVKNSKGNVVKVNFGQKGMNIKKDNPEARASFRARHKCDQKKDKTSAGYWSCKKW